MSDTEKINKEIHDLTPPRTMDDEVQKVYQVALLDKKPFGGEVPMVKMSPACHIVYKYLVRYKRWQPHLIYPNIDKIAYDTSIPERTLYRTLNTLIEIGLIKIKHVWVTNSNKFSNRYVVFYPNSINNRTWYDNIGGRLSGSPFDFKFAFKKSTLVEAQVKESELKDTIKK